MIKHYLLCILLVFSSIAFAQSKHSYSFCFEEWSPYSFINEEGEAAGSSISLLKQKLNSENINATFHQLPYSRCVQRVKNKEIDFAIHVDRSDHLALLHESIVDWQLTFAVVKESELTLEDLLKSKGLKILIARDYSYPDKVIELLAKSGFSLSKASYNSNREEQIKNLFNILSSGRVDAMLIDKKWADLVIAQYGFKARTMDKVVHSEPQFIGYHQSNKLKAQIVEWALNAK